MQVVGDTVNLPLPQLVAHAFRDCGLITFKGTGQPGIQVAVVVQAGEGILWCKFGLCPTKD